MSLTAKLSTQVPADIRNRGAKYFHSKAVALDHVSHEKVLASVAGSADYMVDLDLEGSTIHAYCDCPYTYDYGAVCKHIWATLMAVDGRGFAGNAPGPLWLQLEAFDDDPAVFPLPAAARPAALAPPRSQDNGWKNHLAVLSRAVQSAAPTLRPAAEQRLLYVVDVPASEQGNKLLLEMYGQEKKKNGEWGKPKARSVDLSNMGKLGDALDQQIIALLSGAERSNQYGYYHGTSKYSLVGPLLDAVLPLLANTGRVRLRRQTQPTLELEDVAADQETPWQFRVSITRDGKKERWLLSGSFHRGKDRMSVSEPVLVVPGLLFRDGSFGRLDATEAFPWISMLRGTGAIAVPCNKSDEFLRELLQLPQLPTLDMPAELQYREEAMPPQPRLTVKPSKAQYGPPTLQAELTFDYAGQIVAAAKAGRGIYVAADKRFLLRDPGAEEAAMQQLGRLGVRPGWYYGEYAFNLKPAVLPKLVRELTAAGWHVEAEGKLYRSAGNLHLAVRSGRDWFDLDAKADFDGQPVPFPRLLDALRRGDTNVVLDDGSIGMVPEDWLQKYGLLARMGVVEDGKVRFAKVQVGVLDALLASRPEVSFDAQFGRARARLKRFTGIAPIDPPRAFTGTLRSYQREGLGWLRFLRDFGFGGCLADEMGLGKTVQVLALLAGKRKGPALIVVPRSLVFNWKEETARFAPKLKVLIHAGVERDKVAPAFQDYDLVLTTYGILRKDAAVFAAFPFDTCVLDESQAAKNAETETAKAVRLLQADHRYALSGTPVENHLGELWTLFDFLNPGMLGRAALANGALDRAADAPTRDMLAKALRPFILRRTKDQVAKDLPAKTEQTVYCDLEGDQRKLYDELREHYRRSLLPKVDAVGLGRSKIQVLEALLRLRQAACHPGLLDKKRSKDAGAKLELLLAQLGELGESGHKVLVFSQFTSLLALVKPHVDALGMRYEYLDGQTRDRASRVERFQNDPDCRLFLISLKAGGLGLNLTAAEYVFLLDPWWNPAVEAQAIDRSHRIGQTKPVFAYRLIARDTVEEKILALQRSKRELADAILGSNGNLIAQLKREDLELLLS